MDDSYLSSPLKNMPDCWKEDKRMNVVFSPFRPKGLNPVDYESKMRFWADLIDSWCDECGKATLSVKILQNAFKRKRTVPSCLNTVVEELVKSGDLMSKEKFDSLNVNETWTSWAVKNIVKTPAVWSFQKIKEALIEIDSDEIEYVSVKYLKTVGSKMLTKAENENIQLISFDDFVSMSNSANREEATLVLKWLINDRRASTMNNSGKQLVKLGKGPITENELALMKMKQTITRLSHAVDILEKEKCCAIDNAKDFIKKNMRQQAKNSLRRKKEIENQINNKLNSLDNLEALRYRLKNAHSDAEILESYKLGISALKTTFKENGINEDMLCETMTELEEVNEMHEEIENALSQPLGTTTNDELETELASLLNGIDNKNSSIELNLPEVPSFEISPIKEKSLPESSLSS